MHSINSSPFLWRFIDTTKSKSEICLQQSDSKHTSESVIQTCKSDHDVTVGQSLDSMSWLSKLVKARVESTHNASRESHHPLQAKYETPTIKNDSKIDCQAKLISLPTHYNRSSIPSKKRPRSKTPDNDGETITKRFKSGPVTIKEFPLVEKDTQKYTNVPIDDQNSKSKPENICLSNKTVTQRSKVQPSVDQQQEDEDDALDAEVAMYMEDSGPPTVRSFRPMPRDYTPHLVRTDQSERSQDTIDPPLFQSTDGRLHQFSSPLKINREPSQSAIRILDPWPCRYRNSEFGELKKVGELDVEMSSSSWRRPDNNLLVHDQSIT